MDVDLTIRYSDGRLCEIIASRPDAAAPLYRIVSRRADLGSSLTETMRGSTPPLRNHPTAGSTAAVMCLIELAQMQKGGLTVGTGVPCAPRIRAGEPPPQLPTADKLLAHSRLTWHEQRTVLGFA
jgi:hypothetical protein